MLAASLALVSARSVKIDEIEYGFCPDAAQPGTIDQVQVVPFPISLAEGSPLSILATLTLNDVVPAGARVSLDLQKEGLIPLPIPCLELDGEDGPINVGSWLVLKVLKMFIFNRNSLSKRGTHVLKSQTFIRFAKCS